MNAIMLTPCQRTLEQSGTERRQLRILVVIPDTQILHAQ
jgi:hypothetical protein